jgi:hypothetical protein
MDVEKPTEQPSAPDVAQRSAKAMFRYSTWLHLGPGSEDCESVDEEKGEVSCGNPLHFHAWCRLPNQYQHREIREKALAAKARRVRQLKDPESDAHAVLEYDLEELKAGGDQAKEGVAEDLLQKDMWRDMRDTTNDLTEAAEGEEESKWKHITRDRERLRELSRLREERDLADDERDEYDALDRHISEFDEEFDRRYEERIKPRREALMAMEWGELLDQLRDDRIANDANDAFMHVYNTWMYLAGTLDRPKGNPIYGSPESLREAAPEVIEAIEDTFKDLERQHAADLQDARAEGNSSQESRG